MGDDWNRSLEDDWSRAPYMTGIGLWRCRQQSPGDEWNRALDMTLSVSEMFPNDFLN